MNSSYATLNPPFWALYTNHSSYYDDGYYGNATEAPPSLHKPKACEQLNIAVEVRGWAVRIPSALDAWMRREPTCDLREVLIKF